MLVIVLAGRTGWSGRGWGSSSGGSEEARMMPEAMTKQRRTTWRLATWCRSWTVELEMPWQKKRLRQQQEGGE